MLKIHISSIHGTYNKILILPKAYVRQVQGNVYEKEQDTQMDSSFTVTMKEFIYSLLAL